MTATHTTWITRHLQDAANAAVRVGLLPLFDDDDKTVYLERPSDGIWVADVTPEGRKSVAICAQADAEGEQYVDYIGRPAVLAAIAAYGRTGSFRLGTPDGAEDEMYA